MNNNEQQQTLHVNLIHSFIDSLFLEVGGVSVVHYNLLFLWHQDVWTGHESCVQHQRTGNQHQNTKQNQHAHTNDGKTLANNIYSYIFKILKGKKISQVFEKDKMLV